MEEAGKQNGGAQDKAILEGGRGQGAGRGGSWRGRGGREGGGSKRWRDLPVPVPFENIPADLIPSNAVDISEDKSGKLWKVTLSDGDGSGVNFLPRRWSLVKIHYRLWLLDDPEKKTIDSSNLMEGFDGLDGEGEEPAEFNVGARQVIRMLDDGVRSMSRKGEKILLIGHFDYAFGRNSEGDFSSSNIPNGSFVGGEVELVDVEGGGKLEGGGGMKREVLEVGDKEGVYLPLTSNSVLFVRVEGWKEGNGGSKEMIVEEKVIPYLPCWDSWGWMDGGGAKGIPEGIGMELRCMREGDRVRWRVEEEGSGDELVFEVKVEEIEKMMDPFELSLNEKVEVCGRMMEEGMEYWRKGWWETSGCKMERVREYLVEAKVYVKEVPKELGGKVDELLVKALVKLVELEGKVNGMEERKALDYANEAVGIVEGMEEKGLEGMTEVWTVRGELWKRMGEWEKAEKDFGRVVEAMKGKLEGDGGKDEEKLEGELEERLRQMKIKLEGEVENAKQMGIKEKKEYPFRYVPPK